MRVEEFAVIQCVDLTVTFSGEESLRVTQQTLSVLRVELNAVVGMEGSADVGVFQEEVVVGTDETLVVVLGVDLAASGVVAEALSCVGVQVEVVSTEETPVVGVGVRVTVLDRVGLALRGLEEEALVAAETDIGSFDEVSAVLFE